MSQRTSSLRQSVMDHLRWDSRLDSSSIEVDVCETLVRLSGSVKSALAREAAEIDAWLVPGVTGVLNEIQVVYPPGSELPPDEDLIRQVATVLSIHPELMGDSIEAQVQDGIATLRGVVDHYPKRALAEALALGVRGVIRVRNEVAVVPSVKHADRAIAMDIAESMERIQAVDPTYVEITVKDGIVNLSGAVPDRDAYLAADHAARYTRGVVALFNDLMVDKSLEPPRTGPQAAG